MSRINKYKKQCSEEIFLRQKECYERLDTKRRDLPGYINYDNIITSISKLIKELNITDHFLICQLITYLLWLGYFSKDKKYIYSTSDYVIDNLLIGSSVMSGQGKCVNNSYFLRDCLHKMDISSASISTNIGTVKKNGHNVVSFYDGDDIYFYDPTNMDFLYFYNFLKIRGISDDKLKAMIRRKLLVYTEHMTKDMFDDIIEGPFGHYENGVKTKNDISEIDSNSREIISSNIRVIDDFYDDIYNDIIGVCKKLVMKKP